jgi:myo-inositol-1(or 4)-monophosphatase
MQYWRDVSQLRATVALQCADQPKIGVVRNLGPTSWQVADVASGRVDVFWEFGRDVANLLAGSLIAAEAGAIVTDAQGSPWTFASRSFVAAAPGLHAKVIEILADVTVDSCEAA